ncbi:MAG: putative nucleotide-binding protein [Bacteroidetes bacterium]|nr:putative nucleotide-binding protein [Bacteroidota bacterium]
MGSEFSSKSFILPYKFNIMPSFDIASKLDGQLLDNAINVAKKDILNRWDFRDSKSTIELNKKDLLINISTENDMRLDAILDAIHSRMIKQGLDPRGLDESKEHYPSGPLIKKDIKVRQGIEKEASKKIMKDIKDSKIKVTAQIMDDIIRVSSKNINDLQAVIALCRKGNYDVPLQFINMK